MNGLQILGTGYRRLLPRSARRSVWRLRRRLPLRVYDACWAVAPRSWLERWTDHRLSVGSHYWLFILGCNNSGTTLLVELLEKHPLIRSLPKEGQRLTSAIQNSAPLGIGRVFTQRLELFRWTERDSGERVPRLRYDWAVHSDPRPGIRLEKSPPNTLRARWLQRWFAPARFLLLVRNPYAVCEGISRRRGHSIEEAASHWRKVHEVLEEDLPHLTHVLRVSYEEFCDHPDATLARIERFLELPTPFDRSILAGQFRAHNMAGEPTTLRNFNERSIRRLTPVQRASITEIIGEAMARWGYETASAS